MREPQARHCILCISGRPLAGKTTAAVILEQEHGWPVEEVDTLGARILVDQPPCFVRSDRHRFSYPDWSRVEFEAPDRFRDLLRTRLGPATTPILLVGVRCASTIDWLETHFGRRICLLYISAGVRVCEERFAALTGHPASHYERCLQHAIECDQDALRRRAQRVMPNHGSIAALRTRLRAFVGPDGRAHRTALETCSMCARVLPVHYRTEPLRAPLCRGCYEERFNTELCSQCREARPVHYRDGSGLPYCTRCYQRTCNLHTCVRCGREKPVCRRNLDGDPICQECHRRGASKEHSRPKTRSTRAKPGRSREAKR